MGFDLHGLKPQENTKKPEILIKHQSGWQIEDEATQKEWYNAYEEWELENPGVYFRNNVWWWRPLWHYVCIACHGILSGKDIANGQFNGGHRISKTKSLRIAAKLRARIKSGDVVDYYDRHQKEYNEAKEHNKKIQILIDTLHERVKEQYGDIVPRDYPEPHKTDWDNLQAQKKWEASYPFDINNVKEFAEFCEQSGGFEIY
tara:strand:- start:4900 stop:5505 length:606 start_codon:yes stop_codon:yes gene_type:complete